MKYKLKNSIIKFFHLLIIILMSSSASASGSCNERPPAEDFVCNVQSKFVICRMKVRLDLLKESSIEKTYACIEEDKIKVTPLYQSVKNITQENPEVNKSLQDLYLYWLSSMDALKQIMVDRQFGDAGDQVVVEECLVGEEASFLAFTDGKTVLPLPSSQDHKPVFDDDKGLNTGGMGAYSPAPVVDQYLHQRIMDEVMIPMVKGMAAEGCPYKGVLYAGLMIDRDRIKVLEFNGRFGDPEAQPLLVRMQNDIIPVVEAIIDERLDSCRLDIDPRASVCVVMAAGGYPGKYKKGLEIKGIDAANRMRDVVVFHAGTRLDGKKVLSHGGRVLGVTALGDTVETAIKKAYQAVAKIKWSKVHFRKDIGQKALVRMQAVPRVGIVMGSDSDLPVMEGALGIFKKFGIPIEMTVASAHRSPQRAADYALSARQRGIKAIIAGAGHAAHLAGVLAAHTTLPVIGVPIDSSCLQGFDALLSTVQMPPGIPVATVSIGKPGAKNAAILAVQIMAVSDDGLSAQLEAFKKEMAEQVQKKAKKLKAYR